MIKTIREVFKEQFWRELSAAHKASQEKASVSNSDAVVLHLSDYHRSPHATDEKGSKDPRSNGEILWQGQRR